MNSLERINAAVNFGQPDRTPVVAQVFGHAASLAGVALGDYVRDGALLARCQIQALNYYGYDAVFALMDVNVETEALGSVLTYPADRYPSVTSYILADNRPLEDLQVPDPLHAGRMPELLRAVKILRHAVGEKVLVVGCVLGPFTLATQMLGMEHLLYLAADDPEKFTRLLEFSTQVVIRFGLAQIEAGAHLPIVFDPSATPEVIPASFYREFELPCLRQVFNAFSQAGAAVNWLHTAGQATPILPFYPLAGVHLANIDYCVEPQQAMQVLPNTCLDGNIKPFLFVDAQADQVADEAAKLLNTFARRGGFILSSGCEIPPESKPENIAAMVNAVRNSS